MRSDHPAATNGVDSAVSQQSELARVLDGYLAAVEAGEAVDPEELVGRAPGNRRRLSSCLAVLRDVASRVEGSSELGVAVDPSVDTRLGDFRILRMIGRGHGDCLRGRSGLLHRRVALKVLPVRGGARSPAVAAVSDRGPGRGPVAPHEHRADLLGRLRARRALLRDAVHRGPDPGRLDRRPAPTRWAGRAPPVRRRVDRWPRRLPRAVSIQCPLLPLAPSSRGWPKAGPGEPNHPLAPSGRGWPKAG